MQLHWELQLFAACTARRIDGIDDSLVIVRPDTSWTKQQYHLSRVFFWKPSVVPHVAIGQAMQGNACSRVLEILRVPETPSFVSKSRLVQAFNMWVYLNSDC